jgi:hypothetical protein
MEISSRMPAKKIDYDGPCVECGRIARKMYKTAKLCPTCYNRRMGNNNSLYDDMSYKRHLKRTYNISMQEYNQILEDQNGVCLVCGISPEEDGRRLSVDHDHNCCPGSRSCGMCIRGFLCRGCNLSLGYAKDDPNTLERLAMYARGEL